MAMKPGDVISSSSPEEYAKLVEINRLLKAGGKAKKAAAKRLGPRAAMKAHRRLLMVAVACLLFSVGVYAFAPVLIKFPTTPAHGILLNCGTDGIPSKQAVAINSTGFQLATCPGFQGLFRILAGTNATANYTLPQPYLDLYAYPAGQDSVIANRCTDAPAAVNLIKTWTAGYAGNWSLCADYGPVGANGLPGFPITWAVS